MAKGYQTHWNNSWQELWNWITATLRNLILWLIYLHRRHHLHSEWEWWSRSVTWVFQISIILMLTRNFFAIYPWYVHPWKAFFTFFGLTTLWSCLLLWSLEKCAPKDSILCYDCRPMYYAVIVKKVQQIRVYDWNLGFSHLIWDWPVHMCSQSMPLLLYFSAAC